MYDPRTNQWQRDVATIPREGRMRAGAVTSNGVISLLDGRGLPALFQPNLLRSFSATSSCARPGLSANTCAPRPLSRRRLTRSACALGSTGPLPGNAAELKVPPKPSPLECTILPALKRPVVRSAGGRRSVLARHGPPLALRPGAHHRRRHRPARQAQLPDALARAAAQVNFGRHSSHAARASVGAAVANAPCFRCETDSCCCDTHCKSRAARCCPIL